MARALLLTGGLFLGSGVSRAQGYLDLPRASQQAKVMQRIGLTEITINYSRPLVNGRKIWGGLEPYGSVWRGGGYENTTIDPFYPRRGGCKAISNGNHRPALFARRKEIT